MLLLELLHVYTHVFPQSFGAARLTLDRPSKLLKKKVICLAGDLKPLEYAGSFTPCHLQSFAQYYLHRYAWFLYVYVSLCCRLLEEFHADLEDDPGEAEGEGEGEGEREMVEADDCDASASLEGTWTALKLFCSGKPSLSLISPSLPPSLPPSPHLSLPPPSLPPSPISPSIPLSLFS